MKFQEDSMLPHTQPATIRKKRQNSNPGIELPTNPESPAQKWIHHAKRIIKRLYIINKNRFIFTTSFYSRN